MLDFVKPYISSLKLLSPVQRQIRATALGNLAVSSVLPASALDPKKTEPSVTTSCTTLPEFPLSMRLTFRSARRWSFMGSNCPAATLAKAVYSPSVPKSHW